MDGSYGLNSTGKTQKNPIRFAELSGREGT